jgi:SP family general alpha glucoside:H+ symporter-like MFS transporter
MCFLIGNLIGAGVLRGLVTRSDQWAYRIPFALQWFWPVILVPLIWFAPESPWYLVRQNRLEDAEKAIRRLQRSSSGADPQKTLAIIVYTNNLESQLSVGTTYYDCFKGFELRRTEIACMVFSGQALCGLWFAYANSYFFTQVGLDSEQAYSLGIGSIALAFVGCLLNWFLLMPYVGRRTAYTWGMFFMALVLCLIGILNVWTDQTNVAWTQAILTLVWVLAFELSAGQLGWALPAEIGSTRLRQKTICPARNAYYLCSVVAGVLENYFVNPTAWNLKGCTGVQGLFGVDVLLSSSFGLGFVFRRPKTEHSMSLTSYLPRMCLLESLQPQMLTRLTRKITYDLLRSVLAMLVIIKQHKQQTWCWPRAQFQVGYLPRANAPDR